MVFFSPDFPPFSPEGLLLYIDPFIDDLAPQFVDRAVHHLSVCSIRHLPKPLVSCSGQYSTVQGSSPHKCSYEIWWDALNVGAATTPSVMSGLTPLWRFCSTVGPPLAMCHLCGLTIWACGLLGLAMDSLAMDMTHGAGALFKFLCPTTLVWIEFKFILNYC